MERGLYRYRSAHLGFYHFENVGLQKIIDHIFILQGKGNALIHW